MGLQGGALRACTVALLLGLTLAQPATQNTRCQGSAAANLTQPVYLDMVSSAPHSIRAFVHSFLGTVQPNAFPQELVLKIIDDASNEENIREALVYETGFLVCVAIGLVYIVLMPLVGLFLACCRCCGNCGGKMLQEQTSTIGGRRRALYWSTFVVTVIILAGNIVMFKGNDDFRDSLNHSPRQLNNSLQNVDTFLAAVPQQLDYVVNESSKTVNEVKTNLNDIGPLLGGQIQASVNGTLSTTVNSVKLMDQETRNTDAQLSTLTTLLDQLKSDVDTLKSDVTAVKDSLSVTISKPACAGCSGLSLQDLTLDIDVSTSSLDTIKSTVAQIKTLDLPAKITEVETFYDNIPSKVSEQTTNVVTDSQTFLDDIKNQISSVTSQIPLETLSEVSSRIEKLQGDITTYTPHVTSIESIRWRVALAVCFVVLLVVVCNSLGLLLGPIGLQTHDDPTKRSCTADCGGIFLMMSAGFSFLFSWLLMAIVVVLFLVGGNFYTLGCKPWYNGELLKFVDSQFQLGPMLGFNTSITYSEAYRDCVNDKSVWMTFHLNETINLDELLNVSKYTGEIQDLFDNTDITLATITILTASDRTQLEDFSSQATALDMSGVTEQMDKIYEVNLNVTADAVDALAAPQTDATVKADLQRDAAELRKIQASMETTIYPQVRSITATIDSLQSSVGKIQPTVQQVLSDVDTAQDFLNTDVAPIVKDESKKFLDCQLGYFRAYADWAKHTITMEMGRCGLVARTVQSAETILCSQLLDAMNTFWFGLGWCLFFFIPSIILSMKLAKFYRRMKYTDVYEDD